MQMICHLYDLFVFFKEVTREVYNKAHSILGCNGEDTKFGLSGITMNVLD